jgi:hypothetical protein
VPARAIWPARTSRARRIDELFDQGSDCVGPRQLRNLVPEFERVEDVLDIPREAVEVRLEIEPELLLVRP